MQPNERTRGLTPVEIQEFRRVLLDLRASLARAVGRIEREALEPSGGARFQPVDESIEETALDVELEALATEDALGYAVNEALERITEGRFGLCAGCERPIARERLALLTYARDCRDCAQEREDEAGS